MAEIVPVEAVVTEKTYVGKVNFPASTPENLIDWLQFPEDLIQNADEMGLSHRAVKFLLGAMRGKWTLSVILDLPDLAGKLGMSYAEMDEIIRDLLEKNYARLGDRLDLYRLWIVVLHVKGVEFDVAH
jgi:DNA-binding MarR family transcriptional regulator